MLEGRRQGRPGEHGGGRRGDLPARRAARPAINTSRRCLAFAHLQHAILRTVQRRSGCHLHWRERAIIQVRFDARERCDQPSIPQAKPVANPAWWFAHRGDSTPSRREFAGSTVAGCRRSRSPRSHIRHDVDAGVPTEIDDLAVEVEGSQFGCRIVRIIEDERGRLRHAVLHGARGRRGSRRPRRPGYCARRLRR